MIVLYMILGWFLLSCIAGPIIGMVIGNADKLDKW